MKKLYTFILSFLCAGFAQAQNPTFTAQTQSLSGSFKMCVVDMNGDYLDDVVAVSTNYINIHYQAMMGSGFSAITIQTPPPNHLPDWSLAAGDIDNNGKNDLLYGGAYGVSFMKQNDAGNGFTHMAGPQDIFSQRSNFVDLNGDSHLDAFVCHDVEPNVYYLNNGNGTYTFHQGGMGDFATGGNYGSIWVDYDNDGDADLFIAKCRGGNSGAKIDELHRNNGDGTFTNVSVAAGMNEPSQSWSAAWADFDNDGYMDAMIGANSFSDGGHKLRRNNGNGTFTDITAGSGFDTFTGSGREYLAYDFNNDGFVDVLCPSNRIMMNNGDMTFTPHTIQTSAGSVGDLNNDGFLDIQNGNTLYMNNGNTNKWIKLHLQGVASNRNGIGARVEIFGAFGKQIRDVRSGEGFANMSSLNVYFGIGAATAITKVVVKWPSGTVDEILNPTINQALFVLEGSSPALGINDNTLSSFSLYPNPANDFINVTFKTDLVLQTAEIFDLSGKSLLSTPIANEKINVSTLASGVYVLLLKDNTGKKFVQRFIKN